MKSRKGFALIISLVLVIGIVLPGTLALSTDQAATNGELTVTEETPTPTPEVTETPTPTPEVTETPTPTEEPEPMETPVPSETTGNNPPVDPQPDATNGGTGTGAENGGSSEEKSDAVAPEEFTPKAAYNYLVLIQDDEKATKTYLDTLTDEQILALVAYLEPQKNTEGALPYLLAYLELRFPPYEFLSCVNDTVAASLVQAAIPRRMMFRTFAATQNDSGLETSKTVVKKADDSYTLRLEAYATGATYTTETSKPTDIVLVLDTSGSMDEYISVADKSSVDNLDPQYANYYKWDGGLMWHDMRYQDGKWQYKAGSWPFFFWKDCDNSWFGNKAGIKKIDALKIAVDGFLDSTAQNGGDNRVALVTYASGATTVNDLTNDFTSVKNNVWELTANGATYADDGMANAKDVLDKIPADRDSNKVVIMFTDGEPNHQSGFDPDVANAAIATSKGMKDEGVTVYTVGVMEGANNADTTSDFNQYMNYVSSNYPEATSMSSSGEKYEHPDGGNYYLTADNLEALKEIFQSISNEVGGASNSTLNSQTVLKDIISDSFQLPDGADANSIAVYTANCTAINNGVPTFGEDQSSGLSASIAEDGRTITVSGFDYSANYVGQNTTTGELHNPGKKLVVEIPIKVRTGFLGGNNVPTNGDTSGVYDKDGNSVEKFVVPTVNVPIKDVTVTAQDKNVYLLGDLAADQLKAGATVNVGGVPLNLTAENFGLETWQNEYVNITVEIKNKAGEVITDLNDLTDDTTYTVSVNVSPINPGTVTGQTGKGEGEINVFKPELTFQDSTAYYGDNVPTDYSGNLVSTKWFHTQTVDGQEVKTEDRNVTMVGAPNVQAPVLSVEYTPDANKIKDGRIINTKDDIPVAATVKIGEENVNGYTAFLHQNCTPDCGWENPATPGDPAFLIHVKTCTLSITKTGGVAGESYVFDVYKGNEKYSEVTIEGNDTQTLYELPVGTYTIKEDTGWSWRYSANNGGSAALTAQNPTDSITCINEKNKNQWLNGFSNVEKNVFDVND
ncbi:vWA domain-containing protein [Oscillospiraceae bacterium HCP3S3_F4]